jgi:hypothetical protein
MVEHNVVLENQDILQARTLAFVPNPCDSEAAWRRYHHYDIAELAVNDLLDELYALRPVLWGLPPGHWLRKRVKRLEVELAARRGGRK